MADSPSNPPWTASPWIYRGALWGLALLALVVRILDLDQISFRLDSAAAYDRARQFWEGGPFPWTGIENSLGFRNTGALIWFLMIPAALSAQPEAQAAGQAVLWSASVLAIAGAARLLTGSRLLALTAAAVYGLLPAGIFAARGIWAQNILPPLFALSLYHAAVLLRGLSRDTNDPVDQQGPASNRFVPWHLLGMALPVWFAALVHMAAGFPALILTLFFGLHRGLSKSVRCWLLLPVCLAALASLPSVLDGIRSRSQPDNTGEVPAHITKFRGLQAPADGPIQRLQSMLTALPAQLNTFGADGGLYELFPEDAWPLSYAYGLTLLTQVILLLALGGGLLLLRNRWKTPAFPPLLLLLSLLLVPPILIGLALSRPNGSYLFGSYPVLILLPIFLTGLVTQTSIHRSRIQGTLFALALLVMVPAAAYGPLAQAQARRSDPPWPASGQYYLPLAEHRRVAAYMAREGVAPDSLEHLSGPYFQLPYAVLLKRLLISAPPASRAAVIEDLPLRSLIDPGHAQWVAQRATTQLGTVAIRIFPDRISAGAFVAAYRSLPPTAPSRTPEHP
jgi:hypothetical protein